MEDEEHVGARNKEKFDQLIINMFSILFAFINSLIHGEMVKTRWGKQITLWVLFFANLLWIEILFPNKMDPS